MTLEAEKIIEPCRRRRRRRVLFVSGKQLMKLNDTDPGRKPILNLGFAIRNYLTVRVIREYRD